jgi:Trk K+ transport system NAD-binding subunit
VILGGGTRGREIARAAAAVGTVHHLDARESTVDGPEGYTARHVPDVESAAGLATVSFEPGDTVIVATPSDRRNLLITQHVRTKFDVDRVLVVVNDPQNHPALELPGVACLCLSTLLGDAVAGAISGAEEKSA